VIIDDPFKVFKSKFSRFPKAFARLSSSIGSFLACFLGRIPFADWEPFSLFSREMNAESLLMSDEFLVRVHPQLREADPLPPVGYWSTAGQSAQVGTKPFSTGTDALSRRVEDLDR
jgi:hypothetical protein